MISIIERLLSRVTDRIVCVSNCEQEDAIAAGISSSKCVVIENGVRSLPLTPRANESGGRAGLSCIRVMFAGRFDRQKGFDIFVEVMRELQNAEGVAVGDYIVGRAEQIPIPSNITLLGWRSREEVQKIFQTADLLLMPSRWEGLPITALEAMRAGLPIFASRVGGLKDLVIDGVTGRLFDLDPTASIAEMIRSTDSKTLRYYGCHSRARFLERYTADLMNEQIVKLYVDLLR